MTSLSDALSQEAKDALRRVLDATSRADANEALDAAFAAVGWARAPVLPRADALSPAQRALHEALADREDLDLRRFDVPLVRRRAWLGLEPPGVLERWVRFRFEGHDRHEPLWRALRLVEEAADHDGRDDILAKLTLDERLRGFGEVNGYGAETPYRLERETLFDHRDIDNLKTLRDEGLAWAPAFADRLLQEGAQRPPDGVLWPTFIALVRAKLPLDPRWDALLPIGFGDYQSLTDECVRAIPWERRTSAIVAALEGDAYVAEKGLPLLAQYPSRELAEKILAAADDDRLGKARIVTEVRKIGREHPVVRAALEAYSHAPSARAAEKTPERDGRPIAPPSPPKEKAKGKAKPKTKAKAKTNAKTNARAKAKTKANAKTKVKVKVKAKTNAKAKATRR